MVAVDVVNSVVMGILVVLVVMFIVAVFRIDSRTKRLLAMCQEILERTSKGDTDN